MTTESEPDYKYYVLIHSERPLPIGPFASEDEAAQWKVDNIKGDGIRRASWQVLPMQSPLES